MGIGLDEMLGDQVAGAFHTRHMAPAVAVLRDAAADVTVTDPAATLLSDADGAAVALTTELGMVVARGTEHLVAAPWAPRPVEIIQWLVEDGDPVSQGQPLIRVQQPREGA